MSYDEGWNGKWIHRPWDGQEPEVKPVVVQQRDQDPKPTLYVVDKGVVKALKLSNKAGF